MNKNKRFKLIKENEEVTSVQNLLDMSSKAQIAVLPLVDVCLKYNNSEVKVLANQVNSSISALSDKIRELVMNDGEIVEEKKPIEQPIEENILETLVERRLNKLIQEAEEKVYSKLLKEFGEETTEEVKEEVKEKVKEEEEKVELNTSTKINITKPLGNIIKVLSDEDFKSFKEEMIDTLSSVKDEELFKLVTELQSSENVEDFNTIMDKVYDFADEKGYLLETNIN